MAEEKITAAEPVYTKDELIRSSKYKNRRDALRALLEDDKSYGVKEAEEIINKFMKGSV